ncbi:MAG: T9SS C-terminal target domain-containing protein, partial [Runella slithyformis]
PGNMRLRFMSEAEGTATLTITDLAGKVMQEENFDKIAKGIEASLNLDHLPKGIYLLSLTDAQGTSTQRFVKE